MQIFAITLYCTMLFFLVVYLVLFWSIGRISGRYFDDKLKNQKQKLPFVIRVATSRPAARATCYYACILGNSMRSKYIPKKIRHNYLNNFGSIDYRSLARKRDWILAIVFWGCGLGVLISAIIICVISAVQGLH